MNYKIPMNFVADLKQMPRSIWVLFFSVLINRAGTMVLPFLILYANKSLRYSITEAGLVLSIYGIASIVAGPLSGYLTDRFGPSRVMQLALVGSGLVLFAFLFVREFWAVSLVTALFALTTESFRPASDVAISQLVPAHLTKQAYTLIRWGINLGMSIGPVAGGFLAQYSYPALFVVDGVTTLLAAVTLYVGGFSHLTPVSAEAKPGKKRLPFFEALSDKSFLYFLIATAPISFIYTQVNSTLPVFIVNELHFSEAAFGLLLAINTVLIIFTEIPLNSAMGKWSPARSLALGGVSFAVGYGLMAFTHSAWGLSVSIVIWTIGEMIFFPSSSAYVITISPPHKRGEYMGMFYMAWSLAFVIAPPVGTKIMSTWGSNTLWLLLMGIGFLSAIMVWRPWASGVKST